MTTTPKIQALEIRLKSANDLLDSSLEMRVQGLGPLVHVFDELRAELEASKSKLEAALCEALIEEIRADALKIEELCKGRPLVNYAGFVDATIGKTKSMVALRKQYEQQSKALEWLTEARRRSYPEPL